MSFCMDQIVTIEWPNIVPRLRIGDCCEIDILHWELCDIHGSWRPHLAVFFTRVNGSRPWWFLFLHVSSNLLLTPGCFIKPSGESSAHPSLTTSLSALRPSPAAIGSLFRAPSTRCRMLLLHCCEPSVLTPTAIFDELLLITVLMTPRTTSHLTWHSPAVRRRLTQALVRNVSRHTTLLFLVVLWLRPQPPRAARPLALPCASVRKLLWSGLFITLVALEVCWSSTTTLRADSSQPSPS